MDPNQPVKRRSPWLYVGLGCLALVVLVVGGLVISGLYVGSKMKDFAAEMKDPVARDNAAKAKLGAKQLPAGYYTQMSISVPMLMDMVILTDRPPKASGEPSEGMDKRQFMYMNVISKGQDQKDLDDYFSGKTNDPAVPRHSNIYGDGKEL